MLRIFIISVFCTVAVISKAQTTDSNVEENKIKSTSIEEIVVTATKTETKIENSTVPLSVIAKKYIKASAQLS